MLNLEAIHQVKPWRNTLPPMDPVGNKYVPEIAKVESVNLFLQSMWCKVDIQQVPL